MWAALTAWAVGHGIRLQSLSDLDLEAYLSSRGGADELSLRYAWRLLRLADWVLAHHALAHDLEPNLAAVELMARRPDIRFANGSDSDPLPDFLPASEAKRLVTFLSAARPGRGSPGQPWHEVRNRASVGLMLGAGLTPGEIRGLKLDDLAVDGGRLKGVPWKLRVAGNGNAPARETPVAGWAGQLLAYWLTVRAEQGIPGEMLFPSTKSTGKPWGKVAQYNAAKEVLTSAAIDDVEGGSFRLRHTFALRQLRRGKSPDEVAQWLGVSDPAVMARYRRVIVAPIDVV
jgi:integrase